MANIHMLHISKLEDFKEWLLKYGWEIEEPKGIYEVLRARKAGRKNPLIVYTKADAKEHLSLMDRDSWVVGAFLRDCKKPKTNFDICCESIENMAQVIDIAKCGWTKKQIIEWLQSEVEE